MTRLERVVVRYKCDNPLCGFTADDTNQGRWSKLTDHAGIEFHFCRYDCIQKWAYNRVTEGFDK